MLSFKNKQSKTQRTQPLRTLVRCAYTVCSNDNLLQETLHHIETCFTEINGYPKCLLKQNLILLQPATKAITTISIAETTTIRT